MKLDNGKRYPWLLTLPQTYILTGVVLLGNVAVLVALISGASENREALEELAREVELAAIAEEPKPPQVEPHEPEKRSPPRVATEERSLRVSVPDDWHWTGCRAAASDVEILFSPP
jgi:hypothetical protein